MRESKFFLAAVTILVIGVVAMLSYDPAIFAAPNHTPSSVYRYDPSLYVNGGPESSGPDFQFAIIER
jgi:hypothetical protein